MNYEEIIVIKGIDCTKKIEDIQDKITNILLEISKEYNIKYYELDSNRIARELKIIGVKK